MPPSHHAWRLSRTARSATWLLLDESAARTFICLAAAPLLSLLGAEMSTIGAPLWQCASIAVAGMCIGLMGLHAARIVHMRRHHGGIRLLCFGFRTETRFDDCYQGLIGTLARLGGALNWSHGTRNSFEHDIDLLLRQPSQPAQPAQTRESLPPDAS